LSKENHEIGTIIQAETFTVELIHEVLLTSLIPPLRWWGHSTWQNTQETYIILISHTILSLV